MKPATFAIALCLIGGLATAQAPLPDHLEVFDQLLDTSVRDGRVYYRALKAGRQGLDRYVETLTARAPGADARNESLAFWLNAYNALVLQTVIDHYPITLRTRQFPAQSIRQIPGAFDRVRHAVGGRSLTLDQIEQQVLPEFRDARVFLALGRGAIGGGRLRSEAYVAERLEEQLAAAAAECVDRAQCFQLEPQSGRLRVSQVFAWRRSEFIDGYADQSARVFGKRSPIERAVLALISPKLLAAEREFLAGGNFRMEYSPFDWSLNDLTKTSGR